MENVTSTAPGEKLDEKLAKLVFRPSVTECKHPVKNNVPEVDSLMLLSTASQL
jgi:hypothetical protein